MENVMIIAIIAVIVLSATLYIVREKKKGKKCIGCPYADQCSTKACTCSQNDGTSCCGK